MDRNQQLDMLRRQRRTLKALRRRRRRAIVLAVAAVALVGVAIGGVLAYLSGQPSSEAATPAEIGGVPVIVDLLQEGIPGRVGQVMKIQHIVIHETGNSGAGADAAAHNSYIHKQASATAISWHYTVDDHEIYKHLPDNEVGFHAGDKFAENGGNMNGIGIEMCINPEGNFDQTLKNTAALVNYLMKEYGLDISDVKKHQDFSGKVCPENLILNNRWEEFLQMIQAAEL